MTAYCFVDVTEVTGPEALDAYRRQVGETVACHGGRYLLVGGALDAVEGTWRPSFPVIIEFPSLDHARRWYGSEEYRALKALRLAATHGHAVFMAGLPADCAAKAAA
jgi:uncharacterized protein (DUF1330 family)